ncbi:MULTISPECIES: WPE palindromic element domain-containing protein [unclassified Wolbachia]|nr:MULTISPECIES: WPE palindromic element domain-containing protein [unclassified Wolbachia]
MGIASIKNGVIPVPRHWDPEDLTLNKWLYNKNWIPVGFVAPLKERTGSY